MIELPSSLFALIVSLYQAAPKNMEKESETLEKYISINERLGRGADTELLTGFTRAGMYFLIAANMAA